MTCRNPRQSGVALLMVVVSIAVLAVIGIQISYTSRVDLSISQNARFRMQSHYMALSAAKLSLLRMHLYMNARNLSSKNEQFQNFVPGALLDQIWSLPMPMLPFSGMKLERPWPGQMSVVIRTEGSKIPINLLDGDENRGSSETIKKTVVAQIKDLIETMLEDDEMSDKYPDLEADDLINPLIDWIDSDNQDAYGGEEKRLYEDLGYEPRNSRIPTLSEIHMIKGWTEDLYNRIAKKHFSVHNLSTKINPNFIPLDRIRAAHPLLSASDLAKIQARRLEVPFSDMQQMETWIVTSIDLDNGRDFKWPESIASAESEPFEKIFTIDAAGIVSGVKRSVKVSVRLEEEKKPAPSEGSGDSGDAGDSGNPPPAKNLTELKIISVEEGT